MHAALLDDAYRRHVHMVLYARKGAGTWSDNDCLTSFHVQLGDFVVVRINEEDYAWTQPRASRDIGPGELVAFTDLETTQVPLPEAAAPYIAAQVSDGQWAIEFDFSRDPENRRTLLAVGEEFMGAAQRALEQGELRVFVETAFHAAESFAKAELLSYPIVSAEVEASRKHSRLQSAYDLWAHLENTDRRFPALLRAFGKLRGAATYADQTFALSGDDANELMTTLRDLGTHAGSVAASDEPRVINLIAKRQLQPGELIWEHDAAIRPERRRRSGSS